MYSIQTWIYGCPFNEEFSDFISEGKWINEDGCIISDELDLENVEGANTLYHGCSSQICGYFGIKLGETDECIDAIQIKDGKVLAKKTFSLTPTEEQKKEAEDAINALPDEIKNMLPPIGVYLVFSTS